ncbi:MAG TPA: ATP-binding cassette domain-containing protein, partial [Acidimicrobiales bacterium]
MPRTREPVGVGVEPPDRLLAVDGVSKAFGGIVAVRDVTFGVAAGESVGLIGPNGAGKTTLFDCIGGQLRPDRGTVALGGHDLGHR